MTTTNYRSGEFARYIHRYIITSSAHRYIITSTSSAQHRYMIINSAQTNTWPGPVCVRVLQPPRQPSRGWMGSRVGWGSLSWRVVNDDD